MKAGAIRLAASLGLCPDRPDTGPGRPKVPGDPEGAWIRPGAASISMPASPLARHLPALQTT